MEYAIRVCIAQQGDVISLYEVAEAMARHAASGYGKSPLHGPTLQGRRPISIAILVDAARDGRLIVCDTNGQVASAQQLCESSKLPLEWGFDDPKARDIMALHTKESNLVDWGRSNDDVFHIVDTSDEVVVTDLKNHEGEVIEAGYFRSYVRGLDYSSPAYKPPVVALVPAGASEDMEPVQDAPIRPVNKKTPETLAFVASVHTALTGVWNDWKSNQARDPSLIEPTKSEMCDAAFKKLIGAKGKRKAATISMIRDAAKDWHKPQSATVPVSASVAPPTRHPFKGDK